MSLPKPPTGVATSTGGSPASEDAVRVWVADPAEPEAVEVGPEPPPQAALTLPEALALRRRLLDDAWLFDDDTAYAAGVEDALAACAAVPGFQPLHRALRVPADELPLASESPLWGTPPPSSGER